MTKGTRVRVHHVFEGQRDQETDMVGKLGTVQGNIYDHHAGPRTLALGPEVKVRLDDGREIVAFDSQLEDVSAIEELGDLAASEGA